LWLIYASTFGFFYLFRLPVKEQQETPKYTPMARSYQAKLSAVGFGNMSHLGIEYSPNVRKYMDGRIC
jgi:hypothetical protein